MKTMLIRCALATILLAPALAFAACTSVNASRLEDYLGDINGKYKIKMTLVYDGAAVKGEYFYVSQLKDIALRGSMGENDITLDELDAAGKVVATFRGTLIEECDKIKGTWQKTGSAEKLPFSLKMNSSHSGRLEHRYGIAGDGTDEIVHANAYKFWLGVKNGDKKAVASVINYPLRAQVAGKSKTLRNAKEFIASYDAIFSPAFRQTIADSIPHNMMAGTGGIMLGERGEVWLNDMGKVSSMNN
jgi:hypothetical protein